MRVALTMRIVEADGYSEQRDAISHDWLTRLSDWSMTPILIPNALPDPARFLEAAMPDLLVLTGGEDPGLSPARDRTESALLACALAQDLPVLGVCRGLQVINKYEGGRLSAVAGHVATTHPVHITEPWHELFGVETEVNSYHAVGVIRDDLGNSLVPVAVDPDGRIEAFVHATRAVAAVMWHPERGASQDGNRRLFSTLATSGAFWR